MASIFAANVAAEPTQPMLTWYDSASGERTELSGATLANWVSKTANLLVDGLGLGPGDSALIDLPPHWQTASILLSCWTAGLAITQTGSGDVSFGLPGGGHDFAVGLHPFAMPVGNLPPGVSDWVLSARVHGDHYGGPPADPAALAWHGLTHAELAAQARERAAALGLNRGDRALINVDSHGDPLDWLLAPVAAGASMVLCRSGSVADLERWAATERAVVVTQEPFRRTAAG